MKKLLWVLVISAFTNVTFAVDLKAIEQYKTNYIEQVKPLILKKLSSERPDLSPTGLKVEANTYAAKLADCQLEGLAHFPETYKEQAIMPVVAGDDVGQTTQALNVQIKKDIEAGKISKQQVETMIQNAQQTVQICLNT